MKTEQEIRQIRSELFVRKCKLQAKYNRRDLDDVDARDPQIHIVPALLELIDEILDN